MYDAYEVSPLLSTSLQIETMAAYEKDNEKYLLLGTRQGSLYLYLVTTSNGNDKYEVQVVKVNKSFSKKPIQQIEVIPGLNDNILLSLTDGMLSTHNLNSSNFALIKSYEQTKNATLFAVDVKRATDISSEGPSVPLVRICVVVKKKLQIYMGKNGDFKPHIKEFDLTEIPKCVSLGIDKICVAYRSDYVFYDITTGKSQSLFPTTSSKPVEQTIEKYSDGQFFLGLNNTNVLVDESAEFQLAVQWKSPPISVVWDEPFILGLMQGFITVQTVKPSVYIQELSGLNTARIMYRLKRGFIFVASFGSVWCVTAINVAQQRRMLLNDKHYQLAIRITELSDAPEEEKQEKIEEIRLFHAYDLFSSLKYDKSVTEFIELGIEPSEVIKLFLLPDGKLSEDIPERDREIAIKALIDYLAEIRRRAHGAKEKFVLKMDNWSERDIKKVLEIIDTTLLRCYLETKMDAFLEPLLRVNNCSLEAAEKALMEYGKNSELIILYQTKGQHTKALELLKDHSHQPDSSLKGYQRTKSYLQHLGSEHINLIFKFADWLLRENPEEGLKIFTEDIPEVENLPRAKVLDYLLREHPTLVIPYLEHVIHSWNDTDAQFHNTLIRKYKDRILGQDSPDGKATEHEKQHIKEKFIKFLESSSHYTPALVLVNFPPDSLLQERAVVLGKLEQHDQAVAILVLLLGDIESAKKYCDNIFATKGDPKVYISLMRVLLQPKKARKCCGELTATARALTEPDLETALEILHSHSDVIDSLEVLSVLPDDVPVSRLKKFLCGSLDKLISEKRKSQILKGLLHSQQQQAQTLRSYYESQSVVINDYNVCAVCKKRFGNQSAFVRYPNGQIVHYSCALEGK